MPLSQGKLPVSFARVDRDKKEPHGISITVKYNTTLGNNNASERYPKSVPGAACVKILQDLCCCTYFPKNIRSYHDKKETKRGGLGMFVEPPFQNTNLTVLQHLCGLTPGGVQDLAGYLFIDIWGFVVIIREGNVCGEIVADQRLEGRMPQLGTTTLERTSKGSSD
ncbi:hypothetical protein CEXT_356281 [Caerostris extrusa]|uniref:Uncharacterized protein n=1 Tax=Caerostris extrusa TaxID=172846 RepID=A0AAV4Q6X1_CAEEX|nr:hypothetical protein CEXT_356281 [Caerostris extrusa]